MKKLKNLFIQIFKKREKTVRWNWIFRVGVILLAVAIVLTLTAIVMCILGNIEDFTINGAEPNTLSSTYGMLACLSAIVGMFFLFCGNTQDK